MEKNAYDFYWWTTAIVVGVITTMLANYLTKKYSDFFAKISTQFRKWRLLKDIRMKSTVDSILAGNQKIEYYYYMDVVSRIRWLFAFVMFLSNGYFLNTGWLNNKDFGLFFTAIEIGITLFCTYFFISSARSVTYYIDIVNTVHLKQTSNDIDIEINDLDTNTKVTILNEKGH